MAKTSTTVTSPHEAAAQAAFKQAYDKLGFPRSVGTVMAQPVYARTLAAALAPFTASITTPAVLNPDGSERTAAVVPSVEKAVYHLILGAGNPSALGAKLLADSFLTKAGVVSVEDF
jgi:hypothetical protein